MKVELKCDYMRISGHTWTSTIKTQDKIPEENAILVQISKLNVPCATTYLAMWPSITNVSHDK